MSEALQKRGEEVERKRSEALDAIRAGGLAEPFSLTTFLVSFAISSAFTVGTSLLTAALQKRQRVTQGDRGGQEFQIQRAEQGTPIPEIYGADPGDGLGGGIVVAPIIGWLSRDAQGNVARKHVTKTRASGGGKAGGRPKAPEVETITYDLDVFLIWARGPLVLRRLWAAADTIYQNLTADPTGVPDPDVPPDDPYDPELPHDSNTPYVVPTARFSGALAADTGDALTGTVQAGSYAGIAVYRGTPDQLPDPVMEAAVDALYGEGSTPAYRHVASTRLSNFYLTRYQEAFPPMRALLEHAELKTLADIFGHWCERVGLTSDDYDFSDLASIEVRGFVVAPPYTPKEAMTALAEEFNVYFYESDKIYGLRMSSAPTFTVADSELGWVDEQPADDAVLPELAGEIPQETTIPRRVVIRYYDPARNYEQNSQNEVRQITTGQREDVLEVQLVMTADEAREVAQRKLYRADLESVSHSFSLSYEHIYRNPGDVVTVNRAEGFSHQVRITQLKPGWTVECEGVAIDTASYTQPVSTSPGGVFEVPPVAIPGQTLVAFYDGPALRTEDEGQAGFYVWAVKRVGDGDWSGAALYKIVEGEPQLVTTFDTQAVAGLCVTALGPVTDFSVEDTSRAFTVDPSTDVFTLTAHGFQSGETVMVFSYGTIPAGLSASTLYYARDITANTFKLALTPGGSAVDITSAGTGTHAAQRVIEVDLHDQTTTLESVTLDMIANGANACLIGNEVIQVRTWELVAGYDRRWRGKDFTRGLRGSQPYASSHVAGEKFLSIDSAVKFVAQDIGELDTLREYKAVTSGQSLDDAATVEFAWSGGTLHYHVPGLQASLDASTGDWRFRIYGEETRDPLGELYRLEIVGGRAFALRGGISRPMSLQSTSTLAFDPPSPGLGVYVEADLPGNSVTGATAYAHQKVEGWRSIVSFTFSTDLTAADSGSLTSLFALISPTGLAVSLEIRPQTSTHAPRLRVVISGISLTVVVFEDTAGEPTGTRYSVEFIDGKLRFYRNRTQGGAPFFVYAPDANFAFPNLVQASPNTDTTFSDIEIEDEGAAVLYTADEQEADGFTLPLTSVTVRASQQRVVGGVEVSGQVAELTFP